MVLVLPFAGRRLWASSAAMSVCAVSLAARVRAKMCALRSSSEIADRDANGNTYQDRKLTDASVHRILKNFPSEAQLHALVEAGSGKSPTYRTWQYYWTFEYRVPELRSPSPTGSKPGPRDDGEIR
jgi:hypothetical protein